MATEETSSRNEVEIDLDKYMKLIDQLDEQEDKIKEMQEEARKARCNSNHQKENSWIYFLMITTSMKNLSSDLYHLD